MANAGGSFGGDLLDSTPEEWARTYEINVLHAAHAVRTAVPHLERGGGGSVLIVASITGWKPGPRSSYASAKAAPTGYFPRPKSAGDGPKDHIR